MVNKWTTRDQKLLRRKQRKAEKKFFNEPEVKKKKTKRYPRERDSEQRDNDNDASLDIY